MSADTRARPRRPISKATAKKLAKNLAARELFNYLGVGQPYEDHGCDGVGCKQCDMVSAEIKALAWRLDLAADDLPEDLIASLVGGGEA
jgi:hypothetical protein